MDFQNMPHRKKSSRRNKYGKRATKKLRSKINEQRKSLFDKFTNIADDYEDQMNVAEQEYEAKLIQAEIEKKKLEEEVSRLKGLLAARESSQRSLRSDSTTNTASMGAVTPTQRTGTGGVAASATLAQTPYTPVLVPVHSHNSQHSAHSVNSHQSHNTFITHHTQQQPPQPQHQVYSSNGSVAGFQQVTQSNHSLHQRQDTPLFRPVGSSQSVDMVISVATPMAVEHNFNGHLPTTSMELREVSDEGRMSDMHDGFMMQERLKHKMSPSVQRSADFQTKIAKSFAGGQMTPHLEAADIDEDSLGDFDYVFADDYDHYEEHEIDLPHRHRHKHLRGRPESEDSEEATPEPAMRKSKKKKRRKKKVKESRSFWDVFVKCMTPTICEADAE
mmetsp:Transcript_33669/g.53891  ORF Transcript_33669/g.53891 Transcript_33669/m.53891 type:complete len:388 (+) Transcript_33669:2-1165(+)